MLLSTPSSCVWEVLTQESWWEREPKMPHSWYLSFPCGLGPGTWPGFDPSGPLTWTLHLELAMKRSRDIENLSNILFSELVPSVQSVEVVQWAAGFRCFGYKNQKMWSWTLLWCDIWLWSWLLWAFSAIPWVKQCPFSWLLIQKQLVPSKNTTFFFS